MAFPTVVGWRKFQDVGAELEWLQRTLKRLRAMLDDAEQMQIKDEGMMLQLQEISDLACDAEDVIDQLEYEELRRKVEDGGGSGSGGSSRSSPRLSNKAEKHCSNRPKICLQIRDFFLKNNGHNA